MTEFNSGSGGGRGAFVSSRTILLTRLDTFGKETPRTSQDENSPNPDLARELRARSSLRDAIMGDFDLGGPAAVVHLDDMMIIGDVVPRSVSRKINSYRVPDEVNLTLPWTALPFDARIVRSALVLHYEGAVTADRFHAGLQNGEGSRVPATAENLRFVGFATEFDDSHDESGDEVRLSAKSLIQILMDQKIPMLLPDPGGAKKAKLPFGHKRIASGTDIPGVIRAMLNVYPQFAIIRGPFVKLEEGDQLPKLDPGRYPRLGVTPMERHRVKSSDAVPYVLRNSSKPGDESFWDAITDLCVSHGLIATIDRFDLVLMRPRTLFRTGPTDYSTSQRRFPRVGGHREQLGDTDEVRRMVFGRNVASVKFKRKFGRIKAPNVRVTSYNPDVKDASKRLLTAVWPKKPSSSEPQATAIQAGTDAASVEYVNHIVYGIVDQDQLEEVAAATWETIARQELSVTFTTEDIASWSDDERFEPGLEPDLLALRSGDPIRLFVAPAEREGSTAISELGVMARRLAGMAGEVGAVAYFTSIGIRHEDAVKILRILRSSDLPDVFRVSGATVTFDIDSGFSISVEMRNYIRFRSEPTKG